MKMNRLFGKIVAAASALMMSISLTACSGDISLGTQGNIVDIMQPDNETADSVTRAYQPIKKPDGSRWRVAYVDIDPYNVTFRQLYYAIENLKADGWLNYDQLPYDPEVDGDTQGLINWLV